MRTKNSLFEDRNNSLDNQAASRAEARRIGWHLENLKVVRLGHFQNNFDEVVNRKNEANFPPSLA